MSIRYKTTNCGAHEHLKICYVSPYNIGPYHVARFNALSKLYPMLTLILIPNLGEKYRPWIVGTSGISFNIVELKASKKLYSHEYLRRELLSILEKLNPDVVVSVGYNWKLMRIAASWAKKRRIPSILPFESTRIDKKRNPIKERIKSFIVPRLFDAAFVGGIRNAEYINSLGMPDKMIWRGQNVVDNEHFKCAFEKRKEQGYRPNFLTVGRLSSEKNIGFLLKAFCNYRMLGGNWELTIVGTGPKENELKASVPLEISDVVHWLGWRQYKDLPKIYASASCFILPSISEPWGLVVNEAMASGLPVLVSRNCGCCPELCWRGVNGYDFDPFDVEELCGLMMKISSCSALELERMGVASMKIVSNFTPETWAVALSDCIGTLLGNDYRKAGFRSSAGGIL